MKQAIKKFFTSSEDANRIALTFKGIAATAIPLIVLMFKVDSDTLNMIVDQIVDILLAVSSAAGATVTVVGLVRKLFNGRWSK